MAKKTIAAPKAEGKTEVRGKLTDHEMALIRELAKSGMTYEQIARRFEPHG